MYQHPERALQRRPLESRADGPANFQLIRSWLMVCDNYHHCRSTSAQNEIAQRELPTRFIDLGSPGEPPCTKLVLSADIAPFCDSRYLTLSHCWGDGKKVPKTYKNTLEKNQQGITSLSKTFSDAVEATRQLGIRYVWIDSLCIVQDDESDFQRECSKMNDIYSQAYCTICALGAKDGDGGLFIPRDPIQLQRQGGPFEFACQRGPLHDRAWAFQEYQLSPRIIQFSKFRISWECHACVAFEDLPHMYSHSEISTIVRSLKPLGHSSMYSAVRLLDGGNHEESHSKWLHAVEAYSARKLSFTKDRLPAISGLASAFASQHGGKYLAGMWEEDILRSLLWQPLHIGKDKISQKRIPSVPSWSWASCTGGVQFNAVEGLHGCHYPPYPYTKCQYISGATDLKGLDPYGEVTGGTLSISSSACSSKIMPCEAFSGQTGDQSLLRYEGFLNKSDYSRVDVSLDVPISTKGAVTVLLLSLWFSDSEVAGLALLPREDGKYERIGTFVGKLVGGGGEYFSSHRTMVDVV